jgi:fermentation-respiration switch protein FrsA (DUF1100 family)
MTRLRQAGDACLVMSLSSSMSKQRRSRSKWSWVLLLGLVALFVIMLSRFEHSQVYHPSREFRATGQELGRPLEEALFKAADGTPLHGWFFRADTNSPHAHLAVLVCHGNAGNISDRLDVCSAFLSTGLNVFVFDYRGYGRCGGKPSEKGTYLDGDAAFRWLQAKGFAPGQIILHGESLGGGIAAELATRHKPAGLVLQSTFTSIPDIGAELFPWLPVRWLSRIHYDTRSKLSRIHVPVMLMHSRADTLVRFRHAEQNFAAANEPKLLWELTGDHNSNLEDSARFAEGIERFLKLLSK